MTKRQKFLVYIASSIPNSKELEALADYQDRDKYILAYRNASFFDKRYLESPLDGVINITTIKAINDCYSDHLVNLAPKSTPEPTDTKESPSKPTTRKRSTKAKTEEASIANTENS